MQIDENVNAVVAAVLKTAAEDAEYHESQVEALKESIAARKDREPSYRQRKALKRETFLAERYRTHLAQLETVHSFVQENAQPESTGGGGLSFVSNTSLHPSEIKDLPGELIEQLNISESDHQEIQILDIFDKVGGELGLDNLIVALYKETGEIFERQKLTGKIYRMINKGMLYSRPHKKGVYSTNEYKDEGPEPE